MHVCVMTHDIDTPILFFLERTAKALLTHRIDIHNLQMLFEQQKNAAFSLYVQSGTGEMHHGKIHSLQSRATFGLLRYS